MRNITPAMILGSLAICTQASAQDSGPVCHQCERIREYNAAHPENNYYWYDDYLKDQKEGKNTSSPKEGSKEKGTQAEKSTKG
ncbi:MAG: hypothetical protein BGO14_11440 [Chlamydiales bacterium 38-26]|nr:hypothetical protein [Chlamydiales bacterium]OJV11556.1 MAG: hypothetical protein BGO14_11440 [Chlamydiales bacterium 38-26]